jgi:hypothetical protein
MSAREKVFNKIINSLLEKTWTLKTKKKKLTLKNFSGGPAAVSSYAKGTGNKSVLVERKK